MRTIAQSIARLYTAGKLTAEQVQALSTLTDDEKAEILGTEEVDA